MGEKDNNFTGGFTQIENWSYEYINMNRDEILAILHELENKCFNWLNVPKKESED